MSRIISACATQAGCPRPLPSHPDDMTLFRAPPLALTAQEGNVGEGAGSFHRGGAPLGESLGREACGEPVSPYQRTAGRVTRWQIRKGFCFALLGYFTPFLINKSHVSPFLHKVRDKHGVLQ